MILHQKTVNIQRFASIEKRMNNKVCVRLILVNKSTNGNTAKILPTSDKREQVLKHNHKQQNHSFMKNLS